MSILGSLLIFCLVTPFVLSLSIESSDLSKSVEKSDEVQAESFATDHSSSEEEHRRNSSSEEHAKVKINWGPVWDDIEGSNEFVLRYEQQKEKCHATSGKGLQNLIEQSIKLLPLEQIRDLIHSYAKDPEVKALENFLRSPDYKAIIHDIENSNEFKIIQSYTCNILHLDILHQTKDFSQSSEESSEKDSGGIKRLLLKIDSVIPYEKLEQLYKRLLKSDEDLVKAIADLQSEEFHQMSLNLKNNVPAHKQLMEKLKTLGVPVDEIWVYFENIL